MESNCNEYVFCNETVENIENLLDHHYTELARACQMDLDQLIC